jgi:hypothetical protein
MDEKRRIGIEITPEIEEKLIEIGKRAGIDIEQLKRRIELMKEYKRKIYGVWTIPGWMWIATEQDTKFTWAGWTFSPYVPEGEYGSWYIWELDEIGAKTEIEPIYRWKPRPEEISRLREMLKKAMGD